MKFLVLVLLIGCSGAARPPARAATEPLPSNPHDARAQLALRFVRAVVTRDRPRMEALVDARGFCEAAMKVMEEKKFTSTDDCVGQMEPSNAQAMSEYEDAVPKGATIGGTDEYPIDEAKQIYQINVEVEGADQGLIAVMMVGLGGRPYIVFPVKKDE